MENPLKFTQFMHLKFALNQKSGQSKIFSLDTILKGLQDLLLIHHLNSQDGLECTIALHALITLSTLVSL